MNASVKSDRLIQERLQRARVHKMQKKIDSDRKHTDLETGCKNKTEDEEIKEDGINIQIPDGCCKYGRPPKYAVEKLICFAFKQLGLKVVFD